jgi:hypothetical protein
LSLSSHTNKTQQDGSFSAAIDAVIFATEDYYSRQTQTFGTMKSVLKGCQVAVLQCPVIRES